MRALPWVAAAALFFGAAQADERPAPFDRIIPSITPQDVEACEKEDGCLVISRGALRALIAEKERMALHACRNLL